ncbi:MAG: GntR family transcriptional regulator [Victivallaceae bacterium]|nr:GntR family transcriptional regulator [Victivallaceae bacterium]
MEHKEGQKAYQMVEDTIRCRIEDGSYSLGSQLPTELELVSEFNVSRMTVSRGLAELIRENLIKRIPGRGTFVCRREVSSGGVKENSTVVRCVWPGEIYSQPFAGNGIIQGVFDELSARSIQTGIAFYRSSDEFDRIFQNHESGIGYIIWPSPIASVQRRISKLQAAGVPLVILDNAQPGFSGCFVATDNQAGARMVIDHLAACGHKRIAYISPEPTMSSLAERYAGVISALAANGLLACREYFAMIPGDEALLPARYASGKHAFIRNWIERLLAFPESRRPDAIFCSNDFIAVSVMNILIELNLRVPEDFSLVGFDNIDYAQWLPVPLSTVAHDFQSIGRVAGRRLYERFFSGSSYDAAFEKSNDHYLVMPKLVLRDSVKDRRNSDQTQSSLNSK